jgi:hypothetical protein
LRRDAGCSADKGKDQARETVTIRIRRALRLLDSHHPALASHLREAVRTGTACCYQPAQPVRWEV